MTIHDFEVCMLRNSAVLGPVLKRFTGNQCILGCSRGGGSERRPFCVTFEDFEVCMLRNSAVWGPDLKLSEGTRAFWRHVLGVSRGRFVQISSKLDDFDQICR